MKKSIRQVVEEYGVSLHTEGSILRGFCPLHDNKDTASFTIYESTDSWFCYGESIGGDAASFVARMENIPYAEAKQKVTGITDFQTEMGELFDGLHVVEEPTYNDELNIALSKYCRNLLYTRPDLSTQILTFLKKLDLVLQSPVTSVIKERVLKESRELPNLK